MKTLCSECGYQSNLFFLNGICPGCKHDNSVNDYQTGDKFNVNMEGSEHFFRFIDDVIDHIHCNSFFEVDYEALRVDLRHLNKYDEIKLRDDCIIKRIF